MEDDIFDLKNSELGILAGYRWSVVGDRLSVSSQRLANFIFQVTGYRLHVNLKPATCNQ